MKVVIFGGGIAGLTTAHELLETGAEIVVYEADAELGGFAKSSWDGDVPTEHSWRGYAPFYANTFDILKRIPLGRGTVYDNLSIPIDFIHPRDAAAGRALLRPRPSYKDKILVGYRVGKAMVADKRPYTCVGYRDTVLPGLSRDGKSAYVDMVGPGLGLDIDRMSLHHAAWYAQQQLSSAKYAHEHNGVFHSGGGSWHVMTKPTNEAWIKPWANYLRSRGVTIVPGAELAAVNITGDRVVDCDVVVNGAARKISADAYVLSVDPYAAARLTAKAPGEQLARLARLARDPPHVQISFRMVLRPVDGKTPFAAKFGPQTVLTLPDSEFNITICPQELFFPERLTGFARAGRRVWSGTACITNRPGRLFGLPAERLTRQQFEREVISQVTRSRELGLAPGAVEKFEVWKDWSFPAREGGGRVRPRYPKWVNGLGTSENRPSQKTEISNLTLAGAHTRTSMDIWSMEGAVESGKLAAAAVGGRPVPLSTHTPLLIFKALSVADNALYRVGLPNVLDCIIALVVLILAIIIASIVSAARDARARPGKRPIRFSPEHSY